MKCMLTVLKNLYCDRLLSRFFAYADSGLDSDFCDFCGELYAANAQDNFAAYVADRIVYDENAFSVACAYKRAPSDFVERALLLDLSAVYSLVSGVGTRDMYSIGSADKLFSEGWGNARTISSLKAFYAKFGYGDFIRYRAFKFEERKLMPISGGPNITLGELKDYVDEKRLISANIESFLGGLPHSNMLLYGERGTGKSSTVHAMLNNYFSDGLRIVELKKENMLELNALKERLGKIPLKFIIYIDDLSLVSGDERISSLKAALEGCVEGNADNVMIVATSNRRHIIDEKFSAREDSVHSGDSMQEELSLSDRFGLNVLFSSTTKPQYLSILHQMAEDAKLALPTDELDALAERWAISKGGRSPRRAKQFLDLAIACAERNVPIEF